MSVLTQTIPVRIAFDVSLKRLLKWILWIFLIFSSYKAYQFVSILRNNFEFYGELKTWRGWNPFNDARYKRRRVLLISGQSSLGEADLAKRVARVFANQKNCDVYTLIWEEPLRKQVRGVQRFLNYFLNTEIAIMVPGMRYEEIKKVKSNYVYLTGHSEEHPYLKGYFHETDVNLRTDRKMNPIFFQADGLFGAGESNRHVLEKASTLCKKQRPWQRVIDFPPSMAADANIVAPAEPKQIFWCGGNWDKTRRHDYKKLFKILCRDNQLAIYGPKSAWLVPEFSFLQKFYKGFIPSKKVLQVMHACGMTFCFHSLQHIRDGVPSGRIFEATAAATLVISDKHPFVMQHFGDNVLYVDQDRGVDVMIKQVQDHLAWIKANPEKAKAMAWRAHLIFKEKFALEKLVDNFLNVHEEIKKEKQAYKQKKKQHLLKAA